MNSNTAKLYNMTRTENGAPAFASTGSRCLNLFASCGALRAASDYQIIRDFIAAFDEDDDIAMRILFYARDIRGGLGERRFFRTVLSALADYRPSAVIRNLHLIPEYGRYDDLLCLLGTECEGAAAAFIKDRLDEDIANSRAGKNVSLLAKWMPSVNTSSEDTRNAARKLCALLGMSERDYRKTLSALRSRIGIVEDYLRREDYSFAYGALPGKAMLKYMNAFWRNDKKRMEEYYYGVKNGTETINVSTLYPYEIFTETMHECDKKRIGCLDTMWNQLPDYTDSRNALAVIDGSSSMFYCGGNIPLPWAVAHSLGIYFAERNKGTFANTYITFSRTPQLVHIKGDTLADKIEQCMEYNECSNTDLVAVFELLLETAVENRTPQSEFPEMLYIISDMQFDNCVEFESTPFYYVQSLYARYGYKIPQVVFWNVCSRRQSFPVDMNENGVVLVSGASPSIFSMMMSGDINPYGMMMSVLDNERYRDICA